MDFSDLYTLFRKHPVVSTDTRKIIPGSIFFALSGENYNGNQFAYDAISKGAAYAVVSDSSLIHDQFIQVDDTLKSLQDLASKYRNSFQIPVIAITGSNGKTTTKELVTKVLSSTYTVHATVGNLNNHIGVPLTLLSMPESTQIAIIEMGANHPGEIALLCEIAAPTHGLITNIGNAHLEGFGSLDGVKKAKGELYDYLQQHSGHAFVNIDDSRLKEISQSLIKKTTYGLVNSEADIHLRFEENSSVAGFNLIDERRNITLSSGLFGHYNASNVLAAYTTGLHFNIPTALLKKSIAEFTSGANRSEIRTHQGCHVVMDAYNANPSSMSLAVMAFCKLYPKGILVLGDMKELGVNSTNMHLEMLVLLSQQSFWTAFLVGPEFEKARKELSSPDNRLKYYPSVEDLYIEFSWEQIKGAHVLLKASRSMRLEKLLEEKINEKQI